MIMNVMLEVMRMSINKVSAATSIWRLLMIMMMVTMQWTQDKNCGKVRYDNYEEPCAENDDDSK